MEYNNRILSIFAYCSFPLYQYFQLLEKTTHPKNLIPKAILFSHRVTQSIPFSWQTDDSFKS